MDSLRIQLSEDQLEQLASRVADLLVDRMPAQQPATEVLSVQEFAQRIGASPDYARAHREALGGVRIGGRTLFAWPPPWTGNDRDASEGSRPTPDPVASGVQHPRRARPGARVPGQVPTLLPVRQR